MNKVQQIEKMTNAPGFLAALDQSGGSTPKALSLYGINENDYSSDSQMYDLIHQMRCRIIRSAAFSGDRVIGAILFEKTMDREVAGCPVPDFLWQKKQIVPFLKIDKGLMEEKHGVQLMKAMPDINALLLRAKSANIFGTKMRSVIHHANLAGIKNVVAQQFEVANKIISHDLVPIIEPEVNIASPEKADAEQMLLEVLTLHLKDFKSENKVILKLTLPEKSNHYRQLASNAKVMRIVALSGGYTRKQANAILSKNYDMVASFSRALSEDLKVFQSDSDFDAILTRTVSEIFAASVSSKSEHHGNL